MIDKTHLVKVPHTVNSRGDSVFAIGSISEVHHNAVTVRLQGKYSGYTQTLKKDEIKYC